MHNDEICSACVGLLYFVLCVHDNKQQQLNRTESGSSKLSRRNQGAAAEADAVGVEFGLTTRD